jgi:hypothetical protein
VTQGGNNHVYALDVKTWYDEMPRSQKAMALSIAQPKEWSEKSTKRIDQYYASSHCVICTRLAHQGNGKRSQYANENETDSGIP